MCFIESFLRRCRIPDDWIDNKRHPLFMARHAALLVLAGIRLRRPRVLSGAPITVPVSAFNCRF
jgi:hypothetical protein